MRLVPVAQLAVGAVLAQDVATRASGPPLLRAGVAVSERFQRALDGAGVQAVWIEDALSEGIAPHTLVTDETRRRASSAVAGALERARDTMAAGTALPEAAVQELADVAARIVQEVLDSPDAAVHLADMMGADDYLLQHVVDVTSLGVLLARRVFETEGWVDHTGRRRRDGYESRMAKLGLGLLLHDIGKLSIPSEVLNKPGALNPEEWAIVRRHPLAGVELLGEHASFLSRAVVRSHHERYDGNGYPDGLAGDAIHQFARIAAVADVYDAVTSERCYKPAAPPHVGVKIVHDGRDAAFDPVVVRAFDQVVVPFPPGYAVTLADGRAGVVAAVDPKDRWHPTVRVPGPGGRVEEIAFAELAVDGPGLAQAA